MTWTDLGGMMGGKPSPKKKAKKKAAPKPKKKTKKKAKKKARKAAKASAKKGSACKAPGTQASLPAEGSTGRTAGRAPKGSKSRKSSPSCKSLKPRKSRQGKSGWLFGDYEPGEWSVEQRRCLAPTPRKTGLAEAVAESRLAQRELWDSGFRPGVYPTGPYEPGKRIKHGSKPLSGSSNVIPASYGDPDLRWFVDPEVAGAQAGKIVVAFSGGKDSLACLLLVIECCLQLGLEPSEVIECWHHSVDGRPWFFRGPGDPPGSHEFDWPVTEDYCRAICACLGIPLYFSWRVGGLMGEVLKGGEDDPLLKVWPSGLKELRADQRDRYLEVYGKDPVPGARFTAPMVVELPDGVFEVRGGLYSRSGPQLRRTWPVKGKIGAGRWCSSVAKIDVGRSQISARKDLQGRRILLVTGERAEESGARSGYPAREFDSLYRSGKWQGRHGTQKRHVERWRPIHKWCELDVWALIERWGIRPHPAYRLGWGRLSCMTCIFGSDDMWASIKQIDPARFKRFAQVEQVLDEEKEIVLKEAKRLPKAKKEKAVKEARRRLPLIDKGRPLTERVKQGHAFPHAKKGSRLARIALSQRWSESPIMRPWQLPAGAFGEASGPI